jgi:hypothetical protein
MAGRVMAGRVSRRIAPLIVATGLALILALAGCSPLPHSTSQGGSGSGSGSNSTDQQHPALPASFPSNDVPLVSNDFAYTLALSDSSWSVIARVDDAKTGFAKASDLLVGAGFKKSTDVGGETDGGSLGLFTSDTYTIQLTSSKDSDFGPVVKYTIVKKA